MKAIIIGGSGFIGTRLVESLLATGHEVRILDIRPSVTYPGLCTAVDILDLTALEATLTPCDVLYHLAAEHRDDVRPASRYAQVNIEGTRNVAIAAGRRDIPRIVFTSSVAVYGFAPADSDESAELQPFHEYGRTKLEAEVVLKEWQKAAAGRWLAIVRPTVVFGERNRGNVYNLLRQMTRGFFLMVGSGNNRKSMAYVGNVVAFLSFLGQHDLEEGSPLVVNYIDKPDFTTNELVTLVRKVVLKKRGTGLRIPYVVGWLGGMVFDLLALATGKTFPISRLRVKKFCSTTQFRSSRRNNLGFVAPLTLEQGLTKTLDFEFLRTRAEEDTVEFYTE